MFYLANSKELIRAHLQYGELCTEAEVLLHNLEYYEDVCKEYNEKFYGHLKSEFLEDED